MEFFDRLDGVRERWNVLHHPFYQRWSDGSLSREELATYSGQYRHAVVALAAAARRAAEAAEPSERAELAAHADAEESHISLWDEFALAIGGDPSAAPSPETAACAQAWEGGEDRSLLESLVAMFAIEAAAPAISVTKRDGLATHYGITGDAAAYFDLHATLDVEHAADTRALIEPRLDGADPDWLLGEAEAVLRANWELLDGVERLNDRD